MGAYQGRRDFRAGRGVMLVVVLSTMLTATGAVMTYRERGWNWVVQLTDEALFVTDLRGRRSYPVTDIAGVYEAKGVPTTLLLSGGRRVSLPPVGSSLGNSIRAWLKHSS